MGQIAVGQSATDATDGRLGVWLGVPVLVALGLYAPLAPDLVREWATFSHLSHGFAVPFIAAYLVWNRREQLRALRPEPSLWGLPVLLVGLGALVIGVRGQESFIARISLPVTLLGLTGFLAGPTALRYLWIAIAYLALMIPLPWTTFKLLAYRSRVFDADVSALVLNWLGVPVYQNGVYLHMAPITLEVADACSSVHYAAPLLALSIAYIFLVPRPAAIRIALVAMTIPLAVTANIIRIVTIALGVQYLGVWTLQSVYHMFSGTVNFLLTLLLLLALDRSLVYWTRSRG